MVADRGEVRRRLCLYRLSSLAHGICAYLYILFCYDNTNALNFFDLPQATEIFGTSDNKKTSDNSSQTIRRLHIPSYLTKEIYTVYPCLVVSCIRGHENLNGSHSQPLATSRISTHSRSTYMYAVHVLKPHEAQRDLFALSNLRFGQLYDLRCVWLLCVLYIFKSKRRAVDEELDLAWLLTGFSLALDDE